MERVFGYIEATGESRNCLRGVVERVDEYNRRVEIIWRGPGRNWAEVSEDVESVGQSNLRSFNGRDEQVEYVREWRILGFQGNPTRGDLVRPRPGREPRRRYWFEMLDEETDFSPSPATEIVGNAPTPRADGWLRERAQRIQIPQHVSDSARNWVESSTDPF